jgi:Arc/MetJ-type ribon-helix-helix transcriptional regulator
MIIRLPDELARYIDERVRSGRFSSDEEAITEAVRRFRQWEQEDESTRNSPDTSSKPVTSSVTALKPIWEEIEEISASIPEEELRKLPADGATEHDHYIYGTMKRKNVE